MSGAIACGGPISCCLHAKEPENVKPSLDPSTVLLTVTLLNDDLQPFTLNPKMTVDDVHKRYDRLTGRLRAAEFIVKTIFDRVSELRKLMDKETNPPFKVHNTHEIPPSTTLPGNPSKTSHNSPLSSGPLPTPLPTPSIAPTSSPFPPNPPTLHHSDSCSSSSDWTQRCTAYYAKRKLQEEAMKARRASQDGSSSRHSSFHGSNPHAHARAQSYAGPPPQEQRQQQQQPPLPQPHERARTRDQMRKAAIVVPAWNAYTRGWELIQSTLEGGLGPNISPPSSSFDPLSQSPPPFLSMSSIPWPVLRTPSDAEIDLCDLTPEDIRDFLLSPHHSPHKTKEMRIREAYLRWHPDKASKWMASVILSDKVRVKQAVDRVSWCLNQLK